jgi:hypothetical protein
MFMAAVAVIQARHDKDQIKKMLTTLNAYE